MKQQTEKKYQNPMANQLARLFAEMQAPRNLVIDPLNTPDKEAFYGVKPETIRVCSSLEEFRAENVTRSVTLEQFVEQSQFTEYTNSLKVSTLQLRQVWNDDSFQKRHVTELEAELLILTIPTALSSSI